MQSAATRVAAWLVLTLLVAATIGPRVAPALDASFAGLTALCAPAPARSARIDARRPASKDPIALQAPRCGVA